jgi:hypothetical protein
MKHFILSIAAILIAIQQNASSQCIDSLTVAESNLYLIKGAEARENLALCREYRKIDKEVIDQQERIQTKLLDELQKREDKYKRLKKTTLAIGVALLIFIFI